MGKTTKLGEYSIGSPPYKKRKRTRHRTREEKKLIIRAHEEIIDDSHHMLQPMMYPESPKRERARQERDIISNNISEGIITKCTHKESIIDTDGLLVCRYCGVRVKKKKDIKEKIKDLLCTHKNTIVKNGIEICVVCNEKVKEYGVK